MIARALCSPVLARKQNRIGTFKVAPGGRRPMGDPHSIEI